MFYVLYMLFLGLVGYKKWYHYKDRVKLCMMVNDLCDCVTETWFIGCVGTSLFSC